MSRRRCGRARARGFTLTELLVSAAILGIVMVAVLGSMTANQKAFIQRADVSAMQNSLRTALGAVERSLMLTGFAIDPNLALETAAGADLYDGLGRFGSDVLTLHYADPRFRRLASGVTPAGFDLDRPLSAGDTLPAGQRLLLVCSDASEAAYVTVGGYDAATRKVTLAAGAAPFAESARLSAGSCFTRAGTLVRRVERRQYFVAWFAEAGGERPALLQRRGIDLDADGAVDEAPEGWPDAVVPVGGDLGDCEVLALDIEQLQVAYVMNRPSAALAASYQLASGPDSDGNFVFGDAPGVLEVPSATAPSWSGGSSAPGLLHPPVLNEAGCQMAAGTADDCGYGGKRRFTSHPGNVRVVRVSLAARAPRDDQARAQARLEHDSAEEGPLENLAAGDLAAQAQTGHPRLRLQSSVALKNVFQMRHFLPPENNVDGG